IRLHHCQQVGLFRKEKEEKLHSPSGRCVHLVTEVARNAARHHVQRRTRHFQPVSGVVDRGAGSLVAKYLFEYVDRLRHRNQPGDFFFFEVKRIHEQLLYGAPASSAINTGTSPDLSAISSDLVFKTQTHLNDATAIHALQLFHETEVYYMTKKMSDD